MPSSPLGAAEVNVVGSYFRVMSELGSLLHVAAALAIPPGPSMPDRLPVERKVRPPAKTRAGKHPGSPQAVRVYADAATSALGCSEVAIGVSFVTYASLLAPRTKRANPSASRGGSSSSSDTLRVTTDSPCALRVKENFPMAIPVVKYVPSPRLRRKTMTRSPGVYVAESLMKVNRPPAA